MSEHRKRSRKGTPVRSPKSSLGVDRNQRPELLLIAFMNQSKDTLSCLINNRSSMTFAPSAQRKQRRMGSEDLDSLEGYGRGKRSVSVASSTKTNDASTSPDQGRSPKVDKENHRKRATLSPGPAKRTKRYHTENGSSSILSLTLSDTQNGSITTVNTIGTPNALNGRRSQNIVQYGFYQPKQLEPSPLGKEYILESPS